MSRYSLPKHQYIIIGFLVFICLIILLHLKFFGYGNTTSLFSFSNSSTLIPINDASDEINPKILKLYRQQIHGRKINLHTIPDTNDYYVLYSTLVPEVFCRDLVRIGYVGDGGKWVCNPLNVPPNCIIYSLGMRDDPSFEETFQDLTQKKCLIRSLDKDEQNEETMRRISAANGKFMKATIAGKSDTSENHYTFKDVMARVDHFPMFVENALQFPGKILF